MFKPFLLFFYIVLLIPIVYTTDYCSICKIKSHTMCKYKSGPSTLCRNYSSTELTTELKNMIVRLHNTVRNKVASGEEKGKNGLLPSASNMLIIDWDDELAIIAQRWADQCTPIEEENQHDECKTVDRFDVGQNVIDAIKSEIDFVELIKQMIKQWYNEVERVTPDDIDKFKETTEPDDEIGHYSQLIWAKTRYVGCAYVTFKEDDQVICRLVCNYGPTGNIINASMYKKGKPCVECKCNSEEFSAICDGDEHDTKFTTFYENLYLTFDTKRSIRDYDSRDNFRNAIFLNLEPAALHYEEDLLNYQQEPEKEELDLSETNTEIPTTENTLTTENNFSKLSYSNFLLEVVKHFNMSKSSEFLRDLHRLYSKYDRDTTVAPTASTEYTEYDDDVEFRKGSDKPEILSKKPKGRPKTTNQSRKEDKNQPKRQEKELTKKNKDKGDKQKESDKKPKKDKKDEREDKERNIMKQATTPFERKSPSTREKAQPTEDSTKQSQVSTKRSHKGHKHIQGECPYEKPKLPFTFLRREGDACFCLYRVRSCSTKLLAQTYLLLLLMFLYHLISLFYYY